MSILGRYDAANEIQFFSPFRDNLEAKSYSWYYISIAALLIFSAILFLWVRKKPISDSIVSLDSHPLISKILPYSGKGLTQEEIDQILEIENIKSPESKRYKRAQIINQINRLSQKQNSSNLIERKKDPDDRRRFIYYVT